MVAPGGLAGRAGLARARLRRGKPKPEGCRERSGLEAWGAEAAGVKGVKGFAGGARRQLIVCDRWCADDAQGGMGKWLWAI